jgi:Domain of unknown function (DUF4412)
MVGKPLADFLESRGGFVKFLASGVWVAAVLCLTNGVARAADGVLIAQKITTGDTSRTSQVQIEQNRMRTDIVNGPTGPQTVIFDATKQVVDIINVDRKTYTEMTKADLDRLGQQMQDMMGQMQSMMANMSPEQRAQMESMMRGRGRGPAMPSAPKTEYRKVGTDKVGKWTCDKYEGTQNGQKVAEICTVPPAALGLSAADIDLLQQLGQFFKQLIPQGSGVPNVGRLEDQGFSGLPVWSVTTIAGREVRTEVTDVSRQNFPDALFAVPPGFQKDDMMPGRGRGRQ